MKHLLRQVMPVLTRCNPAAKSAKSVVAPQILDVRIKLWRATQKFLTALFSRNIIAAITLSAFLVIILSANTFAQTSVLAPTNGQNICNIQAVGGSSPAYTTLNSIVVSETNNNDFQFATSGSTFTLTLSAPAGWQFNIASLPTFNPSGNDIQTVTGTFTAGKLIITVKGKKTNNIDQFSINGLQVQATATSSLAGPITPSTPNNLGVAAGKNFATLSLAPSVTPSVSVSASPGITVCAGTSVTFTPTPSNGGTPTYKWFIDNVQVGTGSTYTSSSLANGNKINVVMTSSLGCVTSPTATSAFTTMQVNQVTTITTNPSALTQAVCPNGAASLAVVATGTNLTYQWYQNSSNSNVGGTLIGGATSATYIPVTATPGTLYYYVVVTGTCGTLTSTVSGAITVKSPPVITINPSPVSQTVCTNSNVNFSVAATGTGTLSYTWYKNTTALDNGGKITGATSANITLSSLNESFTDNYHVEVNDVNGCTTVSTNASLVVNSNVSITSQPVPVTTVCVGTPNVTLSATGTGTAPFTIQWYKDGTPLNTSADYTVSTPDLNTSPVSTSVTILLTNAGDASSNYYAVITGASGACPAEPTNAAQIIVNTVPTITLSSNAGTDAQLVCAGTAIQDITYDVAGGATGVSISPSTLPAGITTTYAAGVYTIKGTPTVSANFSYVLTVTGGCSPVTINGTLTANLKSGNPTAATASVPTICYGGSTVLTLNGGGGGTGEVIKWYTSSCGGNLVGTGNNLSVSPTITTTYYGRYENPVPCNFTTTCAVVTVTVALLPTANAGTPIVTCSDATQTVSGANGVDIFTGSTATNYTSVQWSSNGGGTITNANSLIAAYYTPTAGERASGAIITLTLTSTNAPCALATSNKTFTITPAIDETSASNVVQTPICSATGLGVQFNIVTTPSGGNGTFTYQWATKSNCGVGGGSGSPVPIPGATNPIYIPTNSIVIGYL